MAETLVVATLMPASGLLEDATVMSFAVYGNKSPGPGNTLDWTGPIDTFLNNIGTYFSTAVSRVSGQVKYKLYNITGALAGGPHGSPVALDTGQILTPAGSGIRMPSEVAIVLTLRGGGWDGAPVEAPDGADPGTAPDRPRARRTGRLYIGPLGTNSADPNGDRPATAASTAFRTHAKTLQTTFQAQLIPLNWGVWSKADANIYPLIRWETDNAFDTQRRRGVAPTARVALDM